MGTSSYSYQWWFSSPLHHQAFSVFVHAARFVPHASIEFAKFMVNESINNHPLKKFDDEDQEVVVILIEASDF
jgi:hypothetical protein